MPGWKRRFLLFSTRSLAVNLVAITDFCETTRHDIEGLDVSHAQQSTSEGLREDTPVVGFNGRHARDQRSYLKQAF